MLYYGVVSMTKDDNIRWVFIVGLGGIRLTLRINKSITWFDMC